MVMTPRIWSVVVLAALVAVTGCSDNGIEPTVPSGGGTTVSFAADLQPIFTAHCVGCHGVGGNGGLNLSMDVAWANLLGVETSGYAPQQRVVVGNPDQSVLYLKLSGAPGVGDRIPQGGMLLDDDLEKFRVWIAQGALNN